VTSQEIVGHILLGLTAILVVGILWRLVRMVVYIAVGIVLLIGLPSLMRGPVPPWLASVAAAGISWLAQLAVHAWDILRSILHG